MKTQAVEWDFEAKQEEELEGFMDDTGVISRNSVEFCVNECSCG